MSVDLNELDRFCRKMIGSHPGDHFSMLGMEFLEVDIRRVRMRMPYSPELVGDPETGVIHGGAITSLLDTCSGFAAGTELDELGFTPTIDLRIDYMSSAVPGRDIFADAEVYRSTDFVIFTRALAHHGDKSRPIACAVGNFFRMPSETFADLRAEFRAGRLGSTEGGAAR